MKGMIFAAGIGSRLRPLTDSCPKALIEVGGKPMLLRVIERMEAAGIREIMVNTHHHAPMVEEYLGTLGRTSRFSRMELNVSHEDTLLDTGGALARISPWADEPLLVYNADILTDFPIEELARCHRGHEVTLLCSSTRPSSRGLLFTPQGRMAGWRNNTTMQTRPESAAHVPGLAMKAFGGIHLIEPEVMARIGSYGREIFPIMDFYIESCEEIDINSCECGSSYLWHDIGSPSKLEAARRAVTAQETP